MSFILNSLLAIIGGLSLAISCLSLAGLAFTTGLLLAGHFDEDVKMVWESSLFLLLFFATVTYFTF